MSYVPVHPLSNNPNSAWEEISKTCNIINLDTTKPSSKVNDKFVRFVCMSDTHSVNVPFEIPYGDVFLHAGDFTQIGQETEVIKFNSWIGALPHKYKVVIAGNHEISFDDSCTIFDHVLYRINPKENYRKYLTNCIYLQDSWVDLFGIKIYGAPWQPHKNGWAFNVMRGKDCMDKWNLIPNNTDILMTHTPPLGYGDLTLSGERAGCVDLLTTIQKRVKPKYHVFGHIHEGYSITSDGTTHFVNASTCNKYYVAKNEPIVFDVPIPNGYFKENNVFTKGCNI